MGIYDEQIRQRVLNDEDIFADSFANLAGSVLGRQVSETLKDERVITKNAIDEILKYYHLKAAELPGSVKSLDDQLEYILRPHGIMYRKVKLTEGWYEDAAGAMLSFNASDGTAVALLPSGLTGYKYKDNESGKYVKVNKKTASSISTDAICFYRPFPLRKIGIRDLMIYMVRSLSAADFALMAIASVAAVSLGMLMPYLNKIIFSDIVVNGTARVVIAMAAFMIFVKISEMLVGSIKSMLTVRLNTKASIAVESASMMRLLSLPAAFFKYHSTGELSARMTQINSLCTMLVNMLMSTGLTAVFSLAYITQMAAYAPGMTAPAMLIIIVNVAFSLFATMLQMKISKQSMELDAQQSSLGFSLISGIQKIKLSGSEKRVFARWANLYSKSAALEYNPPFIIKLNSVIQTAISLAGVIILDYAAVATQVSVSDYYAFNSAYAMVTGAFTSLTGIALTVASIKPLLEMVLPILEAEPEVAENKEVVTRLRGGIEIDNLSFRYREDMPYIFQNLSVKIRPGQYVAVVGKTGCGKSTLMRLLIGFEKPEKGSIYYDGKDINSLDLKSLRRNIGMVMQNTQLFSGTIFSNIAICSPMMSVDDAWKAAEMAGIADDIRDMPMGMHTLLSEGAGAISGGQRQRLAIARAIAPKPKVLMFDEATSALDNITQKKVSESLDGLRCTRIVIAHRLSTIKQCDRIIVLDGGKIIEDGTYDQLIANKGFFAELVARQQVEA